MEMYKQEGSKFWTADFTVNGRRFRKSTKRSKKSEADEVAAEFLRQALQDEAPVRKGPMPTLKEFAEKTFLPFVEKCSLDADTKRYYKTGWRLLKDSEAAKLRLDRITRSQASTLTFPGSGSNANCALRTLRRMLSLAEDEGVIKALPRIQLRKENQRSAVFDAATERRFLEIAPQPLKDVFLIIHDSGARPEEVTRMKLDNVLWDKRVIFIPDGKTKKARRFVPMSDRVREALRARAQGATSPWVFPSKRSKSGHMSYFLLAKQFSEVREEMGLHPDLVLYSARHTMATDLMGDVKDLSKVGKVLGHSSSAISERYVHPEVTQMTELVNQRNTRRAAEAANAATS